jgi:hypothetical protein
MDLHCRHALPLYWFEGEMGLREDDDHRVLCRQTRCWLYHRCPRFVAGDGLRRATIVRDMMWVLLSVAGDDPFQRAIRLLW